MALKAHKPYGLVCQVTAFFVRGSQLKHSCGQWNLKSLKFKLMMYLQVLDGVKERIRDRKVNLLD